MLMWIPATAMPPSPTAAAQRLTDPERTSPAAKIPGRLVSSGAGRRLFARHAGASAMSVPVLMNPFSSRSISGGNQSVHGRAPIIEKRPAFLPYDALLCACFPARLARAFGRQTFFESLFDKESRYSAAPAHDARGTRTFLL